MASAPLVGLSFASDKPEYSWFAFAVLIVVAMTITSKLKKHKK